MGNEDPRYGDVSGSFQGAGLPRPWGRYMLLHELAQGGMGSIFIAKYAGSAGFERYCVIKTLRRQFTEDADAVARFLDEARVVAQLQHANICSVFDVGQVDGRYYLAMDYIAGFDAHALQKRCQQVGAPLPPGILFYIIGETLDALDYAHRLLSPATGTPLGIVHRDISPNNVMVSFEGEVKLIDFGMALSSLKNQRTEPTLLVGKVAYMAPEQATGDPVDARADQFAAAVVLYELLTGEDFYAGLDNKQAIWTRAALGDHRPPSYLRLDPALRVILDRALARDRNARFPSCDDLRQALDAYAWGGGWRGSKAELRKLMAERFSLEMTTQRRLLFGFTDVHVPATLDVVGVAAESPLPEAGRRRATPVPVVVGETTARVPTPSVPAAVSLADGAPVLPSSGAALTMRVDQAPVAASPAPPVAAPLAAPPTLALPPPAQEKLAPAAEQAAPFREVSHSRPALVPVGPRPAVATVVDAPHAPPASKEIDLDLEPPSGLVMVPAPAAEPAEGPVVPLPPVPHTDVVRRRDGTGAGRARRRVLGLLLCATVVGAAWLERVELRRQLEPRGLWPAALSRLPGLEVDAGIAGGSADAGGAVLAVDAGGAASTAPSLDAGAALAILERPMDAGIAPAGSADGGAVAEATRDAGPAVGSVVGSMVDGGPLPGVGGDAGSGGASVIAAAADAGPAGLPMPARDAPAKDKLAWLESRCPTLRCVTDTARLLDKKRLTKAQRAAAERAADRCVARCREDARRPQ